MRDLSSLLGPTAISVTQIERQGDCMMEEFRGPKTAAGEIGSETRTRSKHHVRMDFSRGFAEWLIRRHIGLVASTYHSGQIVFIGAQANGQLAVSATALPRPMGLAAFSQRIYVGCDAQIWRLENILGSGELANDVFDRLYVPRTLHATGDLDIHELAVDASGQIIFANTQFSCVATVSATHAFKPIWKPEFISRVSPGDRCHLNGIALEEGRLRYVTACSTTDVVDGWRAHRRDGGVLIDAETNAIVAEELSLPHSPRVRDGFVYFIESGRGALVQLERSSGAKRDVASFPGFARGLAFAGNYAVVTISSPRRSSLFDELALAGAMQRQGALSWCGLQIVDLRNGDIVEWMRFDGDIAELFDAAIIPGIRAPRGLAPNAPELAELVRGEC